MLQLLGSPHAHCDGISRRRLLLAAGGFAGMSLADLLRAEDSVGIRNSHKAIINIHLDGGPPQMDMIDPKPDAPMELRGEFSPIATKVSGIHVTELMPQLAANIEDFALVRSLVGSIGQHHAFQCQSGFDEKSLASMGGRPAMGCVVSKLKSTPRDSAPAFVDIMQGRPLARDSARPGMLGPAHQPFRPDISQMFHRELEAGMKSELARRGANHKTSLQLNLDLAGGRLDDRQSLVTQFDAQRRAVDASGMMDALDRFSQQAAGILTSGQLATALDLSQADPKCLARYTAAEPTAGHRSTTSEGPEATQKLLLARRLIEAGVRCVSVSISDFDTHSKNFPRMRQLGPIVDHGLCALVSDLRERGMLNDVMIVAWGEFGRSPKVNAGGGRDHWPKVGPAILAGGGIRGGQVIGETDRTAAEVRSRPVTYKDVFATLYHHLGIDARRTTIDDLRGRPRYLLDQGEVLRELV